MLPSFLPSLSFPTFPSFPSSLLSLLSLPSLPFLPSLPGARGRSWGTRAATIPEAPGLGRQDWHPVPSPSSPLLPFISFPSYGTHTVNGQQDWAPHDWHPDGPRHQDRHPVHPLPSLPSIPPLPPLPM